MNNEKGILYGGLFLGSFVLIGILLKKVGNSTTVNNESSDTQVKSKPKSVEVPEPDKFIHLHKENNESSIKEVALFLGIPKEKNSVKRDIRFPPPQSYTMPPRMTMWGT